ncbi:EAL domain-containing protein [Aquibacillus sediminis]|uniref:EAL domain-containing protein n=1 Tax=Aquibacillus sediminis TaxID=2574734 RepID=UPI00110836B4|nr:EAL domain-containing protein [Aquibacillus sediminis]
MKWLKEENGIEENSLFGLYLIQDEKIIDCNQKLARILGYEREQLINLSIYELLDQKEHKSVQANINKRLNNKLTSFHHRKYVKRQDGSYLEVEINGSLTIYNNKPAIVGTVIDYNEVLNKNEMVDDRSNYDLLTGLPNRSIFEYELDNLLENMNDATPFAVMYLDLDDFKQINGNLGHDIGNQLLIGFSQKIKEYVGPDDFVARLNGDEFALLVTGFAEYENVHKLAKDIIALFEEPLVVGKYEVFLSISIGISVYPYSGDDKASLLKSVDIAIYQSKEIGKNNYQIYTPQMNIASYKTFTLKNDLHKAMKSDELEIYFQPRIDPVTNKIVAAEALIRWVHPKWGIVPPKEFIWLAEETGMIISIGDWVLRNVCLQIQKWQNQGYEPITISVNFSPVQFLQSDPSSKIIEIIQQMNIEPKWLEIEITESVLLDNEQQVTSVIEKLRRYGIRFSIDDFGTGYSALNYLKKFNVDLIKLDRSLIKDITQDKYSFEITHALNELAHTLGLKVVAEGVEEVEHLKLLKEMNCDEIQGYLFSEPVNTDEFERLLSDGECVPDIIKEQPVVENKREYFRLSFEYPLGADMTVNRVAGKKVQMGSTEVLIEDISAGGLRFISNVKLPARKDWVLSFHTEVMEQSPTMYGHIVWQHELEDGIYRYGLMFTYEEKDKENMIQLVNKLQVKLKNTPLLPNSRFIDQEKITYMQ